MEIKKEFYRQSAVSHGQSGGAATEYIIVSTFAAIMAAAAVSIVAKVFNQHMEKMAEKFEVEAEPLDMP